MFTTNDITGRWISAAAEPIHNPDGSVIYGQREFMLGDREWTLRFTAYGDEQTSVKLFTLRAEGSYTLGDESPDVAAARQADFHFAKRYLTAHIPAFVELFTASSADGSPWQIDEERDVSRDGCAFIPSVAASPTEYDLVKLDGAQLYFGDRSQDLSDPANRPRRLTEQPLIRQTAGDQ
jgi:hypothetical protein